MTDTHCRIRRVRMKSGADITVLRFQKPSDRAAVMLRQARQIVASRGEDLEGFILLAWGKQGGTTIGSDISDHQPIPRALLPSWVTEVIRRDLVTEYEARRVFDEAYAGPFPPPP